MMKETHSSPRTSSIRALGGPGAPLGGLRGGRGCGCQPGPCPQGKAGVPTGRDGHGPPIPAGSFSMGCVLLPRGGRRGPPSSASSY